MRRDAADDRPSRQTLSGRSFFFFVFFTMDEDGDVKR